MLAGETISGLELVLSRLDAEILREIARLRDYERAVSVIERDHGEALDDEVVAAYEYLSALVDALSRIGTRMNRTNRYLIQAGLTTESVGNTLANRFA